MTEDQFITNKKIELIDLFKNNLFEKLIQKAEIILRDHPTSLDVLNLMGLAHFNLNNFIKSEIYFSQALFLMPNSIEITLNQAITLHKLKKNNEAIYLLKNFSKLNKLDAKAYNILACIYSEIGNVKKSVLYHEKSIQLAPQNYEFITNYANTLRKIGNFEKAKFNYQLALKINHNYNNGYHGLAQLFSENGYFEDAKIQYLKILKNNPQNCKIHYNLSKIKDYEKKDQQVLSMEKLYENRKLSNSDKINISFALGKVFEDLKNYNKSCEYYKKGNEIQFNNGNYKIEYEKLFFEKIKSCFNKQIYKINEKLRNHKKLQKIIFIIGMPRSGTSLIEQILASHSQIIAGGELQCFTDALNKIKWSEDKFTKNKFEDLRNNYLDCININLKNKQIFTDKMPLNFRWIGFILSAFPNAKIINLKRDKDAVCWSIFKNYFQGDGNGFSCNFKNIITYYNYYENIMNFWENKFPGIIYDLDYEIFTQNFEKGLNELFDYLGLNLEKECYEFYKTKRIVSTLSAKQVRKKIYKNSSYEWKYYKEFINYEIELSNIEKLS